MSDEVDVKEVEEVEETVDEVVEEIVEEAPEVDALEVAKLRYLASHYAGDGIDIDKELAHVTGLSLVDGKVSGEAAYRPPVQAKKVVPNGARSRTRKATAQDKIGKRADAIVDGLLAQLKGAK